MASSRSKQQKMMDRWWVRVIIGVVFIGIAYGFASLAIDSAKLLEYAAAIVFLWYGVRHIIRAVRLVF